MSYINLNTSIGDIDQELAERNLSDFIKQSWHIIEPDSVYEHNWHVDAICEHLKAVDDLQIRNLLINMPPRLLKLCSNDTPVLTPEGWKNHGDLKVGDEVFRPNGDHAKIIRLSPKNLATVEVEFTNGEKIKCNEDHMWTLYDRRTKKWETIETRNLIGPKLKVSSGKVKERYVFQLPEQKCLKFEEKNLPIHPYFLGVWIGDGTKSKPCITSHVKDKEHINKIVEECGYDISTICNTVNDEVKVYYFSNQDILSKIRNLNLYKNKHIPNSYKFSSREQRLQLLAGIIDSDGSFIESENRYKIYPGCDKNLAEDIRQLLNSLGIIAEVYNVKPPQKSKWNSQKVQYCVCFSTDMDIPVALPRKRNLHGSVTKRRICVKSIRYLKKPEEGNCITIDKPDGLYLVGKTCIPTHNSSIVSVMWPAWAWIKKAHKRWLYSSYAQSLSTRDSLKCRRIIQSEWYQQRWADKYQITTDQNQKTEFHNSQQGYRIATSVGGSGTGKGGDIICVDDPHKALDIYSQTKTKRTLEWWDKEMSTRGNNPKTVCKVIVMQRLGENDLSEHVLEQGGYEHLNLPMEFEKRRKIHIINTAGKKIKKEYDVKDLPTSIGWVDPRKEEGELLFKGRFSKEDINEFKTRLGVSGYAGQYQQRPSPFKGNIVQKHWWNFYQPEELPSKFDFIALSWDMAFKDTSDSDYVVGQVWGRLGANWYLLDQIREKMDFNKTIDTFKFMNSKWSQANMNVVEDKANGPAVISTLKDKISGIVTYTPVDSKIARLRSISPTIESGNYYLPDPDNVDWVEEYIEELAVFPNGENDDQVDATTQANLYIKGNPAWKNDLLYGETNKDDQQRNLANQFWPGRR